VLATVGTFWIFDYFDASGLVFEHNGHWYYTLEDESKLTVVMYVAELWLMVLVSAIVCLVRCIRSLAGNKFVITNKRFIVKEKGGYISHCALGELTGVSMKKGLLGRLFNYGKIEVCSKAKGIEIVSKCISDPYSIAVRLKEHVDENLKKDYAN